ncbi:RNA polymerase factor sigma-54 [bacterium]|nr:RNA polymerase factor sigma-54 [bacterium]|tara:strand:- start:1304 stop:2629 length:1326 start_codon:yes stop_codon:yes gene_type:complete
MNKITNKISVVTKQRTGLSPQSKLFIKLISLGNFKLDKLISSELEENPCVEEVISSVISKNDFNPNYDENLIQIENEPLTLTEYLVEQLRTMKIDKNYKKIIEVIIFSINDSGYLRLENKEILDLLKKNTKNNYSNIQIEEAINFCQEKFDPPGIFARNLSECLLLQLRFNNSENMVLKEKIILNDIEMLGNSEFEKLSAKYGLSHEFLNSLFEEIKNLNPKPGEQFDDKNIGSYSNDYEAYVYFDNGKLIYQPNKVYKEIKISEYYQKLLEDKSSLSKEVHDFLDTKISNASLLIKTIRERNLMYEKTIKLLCEIQTKFLKHGNKYLKPLKLSDISSKLNVHESTISRITSNKYILTKRGIINLKEFFSNKIDSDNDASSVSIRFLIEEIIENEDSLNPLSDENIKEILKTKGINIARRTIAKYRNLLKIPSSSSRRKAQ